MAAIEDIIKADQVARLQAIAINGYGMDEELVKGISVEEFNTKYPKEQYEVYTEAAIAKFGSDLKKSIANDLEHSSEILEKGKSELKGLVKVTVNNTTGGQSVMFVKSRQDDDIIKGKAASIGEIREWGGKRYKKQANGKWMEVSENGMTRDEHRSEANKISHKEDRTRLNSGQMTKHSHEIEASDLSGKEHSDEEVGLGKKKMEDMSDQERKEYLKTSSKELLGRMQSYLDKKKQDSGEKKAEGLKVGDVYYFKANIKNNSPSPLKMTISFIDDGVVRYKDSKGNAYTKSIEEFKEKYVKK